MEELDNRTFYRKLILIITEKGLIVIIVAIVGFLINRQLKELDQKNSTELEKLKAQNERIIEDQRTSRIAIQAEYTTLLEKQKFNYDSIFLALDYGNKKQIDAINHHHALFLQQEKQEFELKQSIINRENSKEIEQFKVNLNKTLQERFFSFEETLSLSIENLRASNSFENEVRKISLEKISIVWRKINEYDYASELLLYQIYKHDAQVDSLESYTAKYGASGAPGSIWGNGKIVSIKKDYTKAKSELEQMLYVNKFWMNDTIYFNANQYIVTVDSILSTANYDHYRFWFPINTDGKKTILEKDTLQRLLAKKESLRRNIFHIEGILNDKKLKPVQ